MLAVFPVNIGQKTFAQFFKPGVHEGTDIFAPQGTELYAVTSGMVRHSTEGKGGLVVYLQGDDGRKYFYAHLSAYPPGVASQRRVSAGDLIGYVGTTGNAEGRSPHLHFGIYVSGTGAVDPYPDLLAAWGTPKEVPLEQADTKPPPKGAA